jgi:hypothetical protein
LASGYCYYTSGLIPDDFFAASVIERFDNSIASVDQSPLDLELLCSAACDV